ncbi:MAG: alpha/beta hydrolase, partial [Paramuribaculum sp.]|nr:alpha/beta hydrolase [Paramuribaculum sp.]
MSAESIEVCGTKIVYDVTGSGAPLILMHGWGCNSSTVASIAAIAGENHTVYNIDLPGHGASPEPEEVWGVEEYTAAIEKMVKNLGIENPSIIGHSFGGRIGILFASRNKVDKLILVDAAGVKPRRSIRYYYKVYTFKAIKGIINLFLGKEKAKPIIDKVRSKRGSADYAAASPMMKSILSKSVNQDLRKYMPHIKADTLLVWGE